MARRHKKSQNQEYSSQDIPSERVKHALQPVSPLKTTRLSHLIYILLLLTALLGGYYSYRIPQYRSHVGGWWDTVLGRRLQTQQASSEHPHHHHTSVEDQINDLAQALGMPSRDLASAIAVAVRNYVPPASLLSVAATETGPAVQALLKEPPSEAQTPVTPGATNVVSSIVEKFGTFFGMDEP
ncbi:hypothetical protein AN958_01086 [Leucoagaricus sp. SymC.cos]|nr:hypothetical protein AN958_01086 [Leucoagaricus sp. SymC.cos]